MSETRFFVLQDDSWIAGGVIVACQTEADVDLLSDAVGEETQVFEVSPWAVVDVGAACRVLAEDGEVADIFNTGLHTAKITVDI